jgi:hypothetical protein
MDGLPGPFPCPVCGEIIRVYGVASFGDRRPHSPVTKLTICVACYSFVVVTDPVRLASELEVEVFFAAYPEAGDLILEMLARDPDFERKLHQIMHEQPVTPRPRRRHRRRRR